MKYFVFATGRAEADAEIDDERQKDDSAAAAESRHTHLQIEPQWTLNCFIILFVIKLKLIEMLNWCWIIYNRILMEERCGTGGR